MTMSRRRLLTTAGAALGVVRIMRRTPALAAPAELKVPDSLPVDRFDFETQGLEGWTTIQGQWAVEEMAGAPSGTHVLIQRATTNQFNVVVAPPGPYTDIDVSIKFKPIAGREDASGGIVFRFHDGKYYVVRANALEDNVVLYKTVNGVRRALDIVGRKGGYGVDTSVPANQWLSLRVEFRGSRFTTIYNGKRLFDVEDQTFAEAGMVGLWTKADSVTLFDAIVYGQSS